MTFIKLFTPYGASEGILSFFYHGRAREERKIPNAKSQNPNKFQIPIAKARNRRLLVLKLEFEYWGLSGIWDLEFGCFLFSRG
jgi:hypothetical protein